jgi:transmembrane sensor
MPTNEQLQVLLDDYVTGNISAADRQLLLTWLNDPVIVQQAETLLQQELETGRYEADRLPGVHSRLHARLQAVMDSTRPGEEIRTPTPARLRRFRPHKIWWAAAAVVILLLGAGLYRLLQPPAKPAIVAVPETDVPPGGNRAVLTLSNGSTIILDSASNGILAQQGSSEVTKKRDGELVYEPSIVNRESSMTAYNTLTTPRGGQFQLTLPDGTKVWLNAASSITYPTAFTDDERRVAIKGEVYFEVRPRYHKRQQAGETGNKVPFLVQVDGKAEVEVLGTHFNINAYDDEDAIRATLLEGKVKVVATQLQTTNYKPQTILKPGQQASISRTSQNSHLIPVQTADVDQVMAWKNGAFSFENQSVQEVMRQLARWYNIEVVYAGKAPSVTFVGEMGRDVHLSKVLAFLKGSRINCHMEGTGKLVITN